VTTKRKTRAAQAVYRVSQFVATILKHIGVGTILAGPSYLQRR